MFFSMTSWNRGGGGRSTARKRKGDTVVLMSRSISNWGLAFSDLSPRTRTC